ncbi:hypothetical protein E4T39_07059 [Aureobasidium subglaciale]|nr:hypothetical protein E4T39_07059 [Aureobasidium subglaciale]
MLSRFAIAGVLFPLAIYFAGIFIVLLVLVCAAYVCITSFRRLVRRCYRKIKLLYWPEKAFNFLGLPPEIRLMIYTYTFPHDRIYYMTARRLRILPRQPYEDACYEISQPLPALLRVCHLVRRELVPVVQWECSFYITIYSIPDLLYTLELLEKYSLLRLTHSAGLFALTKHIRIRIKDLTLNLQPMVDSQWRDIRVNSALNITTNVWSGRGRGLLRERTTIAILLSRSLRHIRPWLEASDVLVILQCMFRDNTLDKQFLNKMLPWYQRRRKHLTSPV